MDKSLKDDRDYLRSVCEGLESLRVRNKTEIRESQIKAYNGVNKITSDLNKYFFTLSTLLIPIIFSLVSVNVIRQRLNKADSMLITISLLFLIVSIIFGFVHHRVEYIFYVKMLKNKTKQLKMWSAISFWPADPSPEKIRNYFNEYESIRKKTTEIEEEMEVSSSLIPFVLQGFCLLVGIMSIMSIVFRILPWI